MRGIRRHAAGRVRFEATGLEVVERSRRSFEVVSESGVGDGDEGGGRWEIDRLGMSATPCSVTMC